MSSLHKEIDRDIAWLSLGVVGFALVVVTVFGIAYGQVVSVSGSRSVSGSDSQLVSASASPVDQSAGEPVAMVEYKIEIFNASGVKGVANVAKKELEGKITDATLVVTTGNADYQTGSTITFQSTELSQSKLSEQLLLIWPDAKVAVDEVQNSQVQIVLGR